MKDHVFLVTACARKMQGTGKIHDTIQYIYDFGSHTPTY